MYNRDIFLNVGVGYALREYVYRNGGQALQKQLYAFFNLFVSETQKYTYSEQIKALDQKLSGQHFNLLFYATIAFYVACIVAPLVLSGWSYLLIAGMHPQRYVKRSPWALKPTCSRGWLAESRSTGTNCWWGRLRS